MQELQQIIGVVQAGGVLLLLVGAIVGIFRDWWVTGPEHRRQIAEKETEIKFWKDIALRNLKITETAATAVEAVAATVPPPILTAHEAEIARRVVAELRGGG